MSTTSLEQPVRTFSKRWWKNIARAAQPWKFDAERHAIWQMSSAVSWAQFLVGTAVWNWLKVGWGATIVPAAKTVGVVLGVGVKAFWSTVTN